MTPLNRNLAFQHSQEHELYYRTNEFVPALSLPAEIVCTIFKMAVTPPPSFYPVGSPMGARCVRMEINVSQVCRLWRSMALTYPDLWSTFAHDDLWSRTIPVDCLATYLARSRNRLIDLHFRLGNQKREDWVATMDHIVPHVARLRCFSLRIDRAWPAEYLFAEIENLAAPNLEVLEICSPEFEDSQLPFGWQRRARPFFKRGAPKLRFLRMDGASFAKSAPPRWDSMTTVTVQIEHESRTSRYDACPWAALVALLGLPHLTHLSLAGWVFAQPLLTQMGLPATAASLTHLRCSDLMVTRHMWELVRAPKLEFLVLKNLLMRDVWYPFTVAEALDAGPFPALATLVLINCIPIEEAADALLLARATASATRVVLVQTMDYGIMHALLHPRAGVVLWPRLDTLIFLYANIAQEFKGRMRDDSASYLALLERRSANLKRPFKLGLHKDHASRWKAKSPKSWARLNKGGFLLGEFSSSDQQAAIPWPAADDTGFDESSEEHFLIC